MASSKIIMASLLLISLLLFHNIAEAKTIDCGVACGVRCSKSKRPNLCKRACGSCCRTCLCVPPGTSGNYGACSCYANITTRNKVHKCP